VLEFFVRRANEDSLAPKTRSSFAGGIGGGLKSLRAPGHRLKSTIGPHPSLSQSLPALLREHGGNWRREFRAGTPLAGFVSRIGGNRCETTSTDRGSWPNSTGAFFGTPTGRIIGKGPTVRQVPANGKPTSWDPFTSQKAGQTAGKKNRGKKQRRKKCREHFHTSRPIRWGKSIWNGARSESCAVLPRFTLCWRSRRFAKYN